MNGAVFLAEAEITILDDLVKHAKKLALTKDPAKRIVASQWEMTFAEKLRAAEAARRCQTNVVEADEQPRQRAAEDEV